MCITLDHSFIENLKRTFHKHWAALLSISSILFALWIYSAQIQVQEQRDFDEHLSNVNSLIIELRKNLKLTQNIVEYLNSTGKGKPTYGKLITVNLEKSVMDGKIANKELKDFLFTSLFYAIELNKATETASLPELAGTNQRMNLQATIINNTEFKYQTSFNGTLAATQLYQDCLEDWKNMGNRNWKGIDRCNNITFHILRVP
ncbi:MAG: hypothetical protein HY516_02695 [Candidatus Aenigmarchaeota archaeon]|nr:hypothetical protein [Candidatus Aenigmarchaeota archaeon]